MDVQIEGWTKGHGAERQYRYKITSGNMILDEALYAALRPGQKRLWDAFHPSGMVAADYWLVRTSPTDKRMYLSVDLKGVAASFREFPYPLTGPDRRAVSSIATASPRPISSPSPADAGSGWMPR